MIRLEKSDEPEILTRNTQQWTRIVLRKLEDDEVLTKTERSRYNHPDIKNALMKETYEKCAYCESKFRHVTYGDTEHIVAKVEDPAKWFSWPNLTLACDVCNTNKSDSPVDGSTFIDPYDVDPEEHFWQLGSTVWARPGCDAAALTERLLDLNRTDLVEKRSERMANLLRMLDTVERCKDPNLKLLLWEEFNSESKAHNEYAALSRSIVELARMKLDLV